MWKKHKWKKNLALIMAVFLTAGFAQNGKLYINAQENVQEEETADPAQMQEVEEPEVEELPEADQKIEAEEPAEEDTDQESTEGQEEKEDPKDQEKDDVESEVQEAQEVELEAVSEEDDDSEDQTNVEHVQILGADASVVENSVIDVKIYNNDVVSNGKLHTGYIAETVQQKIGESHFVGAYVVTASGEDEIVYVGSYSEENETYIYYALSDDPSTGMRLKVEEGQYIKLVYKTTCYIKYEVRLENGTEVSDGGTFLDRRDSADYGTDVRFQFKAAKGGAGVDYTLVSVKAAGADGKKTEIKTDSDGYGYLKNIKENITVTATVTGTSVYRLVVDKQEGGHVCWAGHADENNSNTKNPYSVDPKKFCSYRASDGATISTEPGGTIYFVAYSQAWTGGGVWEFESLLINDRPLDAVLYDGEEYVMDIGDGMTVHFRYILGGGKDPHLSEGSNKTRCKYECWIENVHEDIHVKFKNFDSENHEIVKLAQAEGIESVCASSFDRRYVGGCFGLFKGSGEGYYDFWIDLYEEVSTVGENVTDITYVGNGESGGIGARPNAPWAQTFWGPGPSLLTYEGHNWFYSKHAHVEMKSKVYSVPEERKETEEWGSRYIYFKTKTGYDPRTLNARITGKGEEPGQATIKLTDIDNIASLATSKVKTLLSNQTNNSSLQLAKKAGYQWYVRYEGAGYNMRNLYLQCDPYQFGVEYDLNGGKWKAGKEYSDGKKYTIEPGTNRISLPGDAPVQNGKNFIGWKLEPINGGYTGSTSELYNTDSIFTVAGANYEAALDTEKIEYELPIVTGGVKKDEDLEITYVKYTDYSPISGGNHRFRFVAQWIDENDPSAEKAEYTVRIYNETASGTAGAVEVDGRTYTLLDEKTYVGIKGEDIVSIQRTPDGYLLDKEKSVVRLRNFMKDGNKENEIVYYFRLPEWKLTQNSDPQGGASEQEAAKVKIKDEIRYSLCLENQEKETVLLPAGTVVTAVLPEGLEVPVNRKAEGTAFAYQPDTRLITYTFTSPREFAAGEILELQYTTRTVEEGGLMESRAFAQVDWKTYESENLYHIISVDLTISNVLKGDYADYTKDFEITVTITDTEGNPLLNKAIEYQGGRLGVMGANQAPAGGNAVLNEQNEFTFHLRHGQTMTLKGLPYGSQYKVVQKEESGYVTTYGGVTGESYQGTNLPIVTGVWPSPEKFADEYEQLTLNPSGIFEYGGEYFAVTRKFKLNRAQAESGPEGKGPDGQTNGWFGVTKLTGKIWDMEEGAENINGLTRGDLVRYKDSYYLFNVSGEWGCNPENDDKNNPQYHNVSKAGAQNNLFEDKVVDITNTYEKVSPTGIQEGSGGNLLPICLAIALMGCAVTGCRVRYRKTRKNM